MKIIERELGKQNVLLKKDISEDDKNLGHHCFVPDVFITFSVVRYYKRKQSFVFHLLLPLALYFYLFILQQYKFFF